MPEQHRHLASKCENIVNLQGAEACVATRTACCITAGQLFVHYYVPASRVGGIKRCCAFDVLRLSVAYIGPKSRTEWPRETKIGTEVAHVTRDSDTALNAFKVKSSKVNLQGRRHIVAAQLVMPCCTT